MIESNESRLLSQMRIFPQTKPLDAENATRGSVGGRKKNGPKSREKWQKAKSRVGLFRRGRTGERTTSTVNRDYAFRGRSKLGEVKCPWAVSITAISPNEVVRPGTLQTPCIFNLTGSLSLEYILCRLTRRFCLSSRTAIGRARD